MSQLRYNWEDGEVSVRMINAQIYYGYAAGSEIDFCPNHAHWMLTLPF